MNLYHQLIFGLTGLKYVKITQGETITAGYINQKGDRIGKWTEREAGEKRYGSYKKDPLDGLWKKDGKWLISTKEKWKKGNYSMGLEQGIWEYYDKKFCHSFLTARISYKNGQKDGPYFLFDKDIELSWGGRKFSFHKKDFLEEKGTYHAGLKEGDAVSYNLLNEETIYHYERGELRSACSSSDNGLRMYFYKKGTIEKEGDVVACIFRHSKTGLKKVRTWVSSKGFKKRLIVMDKKQIIKTYEADGHIRLKQTFFDPFYAPGKIRITKTLTESFYHNGSLMRRVLEIRKKHPDQASQTEKISYLILPEGKVVEARLERNHQVIYDGTQAGLRAWRQQEAMERIRQKADPLQSGLRADFVLLLKEQTSSRQRRMIARIWHQLKAQKERL